MRRFNTFRNELITLNEGEEFCDKCDGEGVIRSKKIYRPLLLTCSKCLGDGKIDWIEKATGKRIKRNER